MCLHHKPHPVKWTHILWLIFKHAKQSFDLITNKMVIHVTTGHEYKTDM